MLHDVRTSSGGMVAAFTGHSSWVLSVDISPDNRLALSGYVEYSLSHSRRLIKVQIRRQNYQSVGHRSTGGCINRTRYWRSVVCVVETQIDIRWGGCLCHWRRRWCSAMVERRRRRKHFLAYSVLPSKSNALSKKLIVRLTRQGFLDKQRYKYYG